MKDHVLLEIDRLIELEENDIPERPYLGMSGLGETCQRKLWYSFRHAKAKDKKAYLIRCAQDGHVGEELMAKRLRMVHGIQLETVDTNGTQVAFSDFDGHLSGHADGKIKGLPHNPDIWHIWEHKQCNEKKFELFLKAKQKFTDSHALKQWDETYYAQAMLYMHYSGILYHYLTVSTPGGRKTSSCITLYDKSVAESLIKKAKHIIYTEEAPERLSNNPEWFACKWCDFQQICHKKEVPQINCRTCLHSEIRGGDWFCTKLDKITGDKMACDGVNHLYFPSMLRGNPVDAGDNYVRYSDGRVNHEGGTIEQGGLIV